MRWLDRFRRDETGSVTIEFVLWIPVIMVLVAIVIDATTIYITHAEMWNVARDTARRMVTGNLMTEAEAEAYAADAMSLRDAPYSVNAEYDQSKNIAMVVIGIRASEAAYMGMSTLLYRAMAREETPLTARVVMRPDPNIPFGTTP